MFDSTIGPESQEGTIRVDRETDGITAVCLEGDCDLTNAPVLDDEIDRALESGTGLILDLSDATFIDSSVIREIVVASRSARHERRRFNVQAPAGRPIARRLRLMHLDRLVPVCHSRVEALAAP